MIKRLYKTTLFESKDCDPFFLLGFLFFIKMKNKFVIVYNWMIKVSNTYNLTTEELTVLAFIYGITYNGSEVFTGPSNYMVKVLEIDIYKIVDIIKKLIDLEILAEYGDGMNLIFDPRLMKAISE